jgi:hypothetical protein
MSQYRITFLEDQDAQFEECNGEARPLTRDEYAEATYRGCPDHPRAGSKTLDATVSPNLTGCAVCGRTDDVDIPYDEYLAYYGNPDRHVYLACLVERQCDCCHVWQTASALGAIDVMNDSPEWRTVQIGRRYTPDEAARLPGYLAEIAREELDEARALDSPTR